MTFVVKRLPEAENDTLEAAAWYDAQQAGLGNRFLDELEEVVQSLSRDAMLYGERFRTVRRVNLPTFPYGVFYRLKGRVVEVLAVLHGARHPRLARNARADAKEVARKTGDGCKLHSERFGLVSNNSCNSHLSFVIFADFV